MFALSKRAFTCCAMLLVISVLTVCGSAYAQTLLWSDEFDGTAIDKNNWTYDVGNSGFGNGELQYYTALPQNARVENGSLIIEGIRESFGGSEFTSARLKSHGRLKFKYGTLEARIKMPDLAEGLWPAFWLLGDNFKQVGWPACGETDIIEMGSEEARNAGLSNKRVGSAAHWDYQTFHAMYNTSLDSAADMFLDYHILRLEWDPAMMRTYLDGVEIWAFDISDPVTNSLEEFHEPAFMLLNLAIGGWNYVNITDPAAITAPLPAKMYIDYVRLYDNGYTELSTVAETQESGNFGVYTETTSVDNALVYGVDADLYIWENMTPIAETPYEGSECWAFNVASGTWFGMGVFCHVDKNMMNYSDGEIRFHAKTTSDAVIRVGVGSSAAGESWTADLDDFGLVRDGAWHEVTIPLNRFCYNVDFNSVYQMLMISGDAPASSFDLAIDNVYWTPSVPKITPEYGNFGVFTETAANKDAGEYILDIDGGFYIWDNTLVAGIESPYEGASSLSLESPGGLGWFGAAFTPYNKYNLTAYRFANSYLHFALKTSSNTDFKIGMKSGNIDIVGQKWIAFENGNDPYGFVRDGQWHVIEIPMTEFAGAVDLSSVYQLFELLGDNGDISDIEIDDICFLNGQDALPDDTGGNPPQDPPGQAVNPSPAAGAAGQSIVVDLSWANGGGATSYDVYFGTDATPDANEYIRNQTGTLYDPGVLAYATTYYWRIDAVNLLGTTAGAVWSFTTGPVPPAPQKAISPDPADGATAQSTDVDLSWADGGGAVSYDIYFGTASPDTYLGNQTGTVLDPGTLAELTTYTWRVDSVNDGGTTVGDVWSFTTGTPKAPVTLEAESGTATDCITEAGGDSGDKVILTGSSSTLEWSNVDMEGRTGVTIHLANAEPAGDTLNVLYNDVVIGSISVPITGGWSAGAFVDVPVSLNPESGSGTLKLQGSGSGWICSVDYVEVSGGFNSEPPPPAGDIYVADITMSVHSAGPNKNGAAAVLIKDESGAVIPNATVSGQWSGLTSDADTGVTDANGVVVLSSDALKKANGMFTFTVTDVSASGRVYNPGLNVESSDSISSDGEEPPPPPPADADMYVADIAMGSVLLSAKKSEYAGTATVTVLDDTGAAVSGAAVSGSWSGAVSGSSEGVTAADGTVTLQSAKKRGGGTFTLTVTDVSASGYIYNSALNVETSDTVTAP